MSNSRKYGRTYHYPFSPGTTSDDRINHDYWKNLEQIQNLVHTEKLDGENTCISKIGVFARSHATPTRHPWANHLQEKWNWLKRDLGELEIFGENLYAIHSIEYQKLEQHFFVFGVREKDQWLSWEETKFYAALLDFPTVPELSFEKAEIEKNYENELLKLTTKSSTFQSADAHTGEPCQMEGIVSRNAAGFPVHAFKENVFKYVRKNHVKTDEHWTRKWKRATLVNEKSQSCGN
jgi:hypothetical protein